MRSGPVLLLVALLALSCTTMSSAPPPETGFLARSITIGETAYPYVVWVPPGFDPARRWPVILFLHGAGERGDDGWRQTAVGLGSAVRWEPGRFAGAVIVFPQAPAGQRWLGDPARAAMAALERTMIEFSGDPARVYLTGLSMGGYGTWYLATEYPDRWAALVPICGGVVSPSTAISVRDHPRAANTADPYAAVAAAVPEVPIWIFHGEEDRSIPVTESRAMAAALETLGREVRYTEYPDVGHNAWDAAYGSGETWEWLFTARR